MTGKQYFVKIANAMRSMEALERKIKELKESATLIKSFDYSKEKVQTSPQNIQEEKIIKIIDIIREYDAQIAQYAEFVLDAERKLATLSRTEYAEVIRLRHLQKEKLSWEDLSYQLGYESEGARTLYRNALTEFEEKYLDANTGKNRKKPK